MIRSSFLHRSPLLLLAVALIALAVFAPGAQPAHAQATTELWSGTLTANSLAVGRMGCDDVLTGARACEPSGALTDDDFTYGGVNYDITRVYVVSTGTYAGQLSLSLDKEIPASLIQAATLHVGNMEFPLANAGLYDSDYEGNNDSASWGNTGLSWNAGDTVELRLTVVPPPGWTLTPKPLGGGSIGCDTLAGSSCSSALSASGDGYEGNRFTYTRNYYGESHTTTYVVRELYLSPQGELVLTMSPSIPPYFTLIAGSESLSFGYAWRSPTETQLRWRNTGLRWAANQQVRVSLNAPRAALDTLRVCYDDDEAGVFDECVPARPASYGLSAMVPNAATHVKLMPRAAHVNPVTAWSSTLTVSSNPNDNAIMGCNALVSASFSCSRLLTGGNFLSFNGLWILVEQIELSPDGELNITFTPRPSTEAIKSISTLHVDDVRLDLAHATLSGSNLVWSGTGLSWAEGQQVQLRLDVEESDTTVRVGTASNTLMAVGHGQKSHAIRLHSGGTLVVVEVSEGGVGGYTNHMHISRTPTEEEQGAYPPREPTPTPTPRPPAPPAPQPSPPPPPKPLPQECPEPVIHHEHALASGAVARHMHQGIMHQGECVYNVSGNLPRDSDHHLHR